MCKLWSQGLTASYLNLSGPLYLPLETKMSMPLDAATRQSLQPPIKFKIGCGLF